jgi:hypothetical protein
MLCVCFLVDERYAHDSHLTFLRSSNDVGRFPCITTAVSATTEIYHHEQPQALGKSMWTAGPEGVSIYSPDGATVIKKMSATDLGCPSPDGCYFFALASDGHSHVWATSLHAFPHRVDVFSIGSGEYVGGVGVCNTPLDLDYVPTREELNMYFQCVLEANPKGRTGPMSNPTRGSW